MRRREFISLVGLAVATRSLPAKAQQPGKMPRVGVLWHAANAAEEDVYLKVLTKAFNDLGYVEGKNIELVHRFPAEQPDQFRAFARELVESKADVLIAVTEFGAREIKLATTTIPTVVVLCADPVRVKLVESLAHPGGNVTGLSLMNSDLSAKRLDLFKEIIPNLSRLAIITDEGTATSVPAYLDAAKTLGLNLRQISVTTPQSIDDAFAEVARDGLDGAFVTGSKLFNARARVGALALAHRIPTQSVIGEITREDGVLFSYGQDFPDFFRKAASYGDKILKGAKPSDLPVEQPTRFKLTINLKTAKALGLDVSPALLVRADEVIE
jgi:putative tryptophan/tyrosine transport system substrate-binding protein